MTTVSRHLSVIVCADVVGYSRLTDAGDAGALAALEEHRKAIDPIFLEDGGRIVKTTAGGLLLEFPSAFYAVRASLSVQRVMAERNKDVPPDKRLAFRMGMHLGDGMVENEDASADGIDIAERLQEMADPGGLGPARAAHAAVYQDFDSIFPDGGATALKDIDTPMRVYNLAPEAAMLPVVPTVMAPRRLSSLVVLPFANSTGETRHDSLADSIADQLTSELARIDDSFVVDRKTALTTAETSEIAALGQRLGIRYIVKGGVSAAEAGLRIGAALIDTATGAEIGGDHLDIADGDPLVMQHDVNTRLVPLVHSRLLAATGHAPQVAPAPATEVRAPRSAPAAAAAPWAALPPRPQVEPRVAANTPSETDALAALIARWPVLRRPRPRLPVPRLPAASAPAPAPTLNIHLLDIDVLDIEAPDIVAPEPPPIPAVVIHPRTVTAPGPTAGRVVMFRPASAAREAATQPRPAPSPYTAQIFEMPTPPLSDRPEWRIPLPLRLFFVTAFAALGGAIAVARLGFERETVVGIVSWVLITTGLAQLTSVIAERVQSARMLRPAEPAWPGAERRPRPKPVAVEILRVRGVPRLSRDISRSTQYAP